MTFFVSLIVVVTTQVGSIFSIFFSYFAYFFELNGLKWNGRRLGVRVWMGGDIQEVPGGAGGDVVAGEFGSGFVVQGST